VTRSILGQSVTLVDHQLIVRTLHDAHSRVMTYGLDGTPRREISLPGPGTAAGFDGHPEDRETFYSFTDLITPPTIYRYDWSLGPAPWCTRRRSRSIPPRSSSARCSTWQGRHAHPDAAGHRKGLKLQGDNPLLLYGYGGFGLSTLPLFNARASPGWNGRRVCDRQYSRWREYGEVWHRQGIRTHKQIVFDDFIAAAEWLIAQHYTSVHRLAIHGRSNGGLLIGACLTQRPDLFGRRSPRWACWTCCASIVLDRARAGRGTTARPKIRRSSRHCTPTRRCTTCIGELTTGDHGDHR